MISDESTLPLLPARDPKGHKGTFGTVAVFGGCAHEDQRMIGAVALAATAALRAGAGLVRIAAPSTVLSAMLTICPSATGMPIPVSAGGRLEPHDAAAGVDMMVGQCQTLVIGPGMGLSDGARAAALRSVYQEDVPVVVDADALNNLAEVPELSRDFLAAAVLTPHPGEFKRLAEALRLSGDPTGPASRPTAAASLAQRLGCIVVLKGSGTVVSDGQRTWVNTTGNAALATAGTGDVLSGLIAGLIAQFVKVDGFDGPARRPTAKPLGLYDAARLAVAAHGLAAEAWVKRHRADAGLLAMELAEGIPAALQSFRGAAER